MPDQWNHKIFNVQEGGFEGLALDIFRYQYERNPVYQQYADFLNIRPAVVREIAEIPFLPIRFFKSHKVLVDGEIPLTVFESSGTTGSVNSRHYVSDTILYKEDFTKGFERTYGPLEDYCVIGLLPSYLERNNSSLVYMVNEMIEHSGHKDSGFYLDDHTKLAKTIERLEKAGQKTLLIGVSFALLDFAEQYPISLTHTIVMETGGMKGRRKELIREELHAILCKAFNVEVIHSEYGMTELLSQAYSRGGGRFNTPPWMKIMLRDEEDPLHILPMKSSRTGVINIIDLANINSCSFIATDDIGRVFPDNSFEVLGRLDNSDLRGCSLLVAL
jgi:phenylacetate-coenzyme A ligase PaaK-like adenylate-forming protein